MSIPVLAVNSNAVECDCRGRSATHPAHHCRAGDFKTNKVTYRSYEIRRRVAKTVVQRFEEQLRAFLASGDDKQAMPQHVQVAPIIACCLPEACQCCLQGINSIRGQMMEELMHRTLPQSGSFLVR